MAAGASQRVRSPGGAAQRRIERLAQRNKLVEGEDGQRPAGCSGRLSDSREFRTATFCHLGCTQECRWSLTLQAACRTLRKESLIF